MNVTPLYSTDNVNFNQLPTTTFTQEGRTSLVFSFSEISAKWIKFILTKRGPDPSGANDFFGYQFGFKNIKFWQQGFSTESAQHFVSAPLFVTDPDTREAIDFEKLTLETCERIETNTDIKYFITTSNDPEVPLVDTTAINDTALWLPISPVNRTVQPYPVVLDIGDFLENTIGDDETVTISYDGRNADPDAVNPSS